MEIKLNSVIRLFKIINHDIGDLMKSVNLKLVYN